MFKSTDVDFRWLPWHCFWRLSDWQDLSNITQTFAAVRVREEAVMKAGNWGCDLLSTFELVWLVSPKPWKNAAQGAFRCFHCEGNVRVVHVSRGLHRVYRLSLFTQVSVYAGVYDTWWHSAYVQCWSRVADRPVQAHRVGLHCVRVRSRQKSERPETSRDRQHLQLWGLGSCAFWMNPLWPLPKSPDLNDLLLPNFLFDCFMGVPLCRIARMRLRVTVTACCKATQASHTPSDRSKANIASKAVAKMSGRWPVDMDK